MSERNQTISDNVTALTARVVVLETGVPAAEVTYTPAVDGDWPDPNPATVTAALDKNAARITLLESAAIKGRLLTVTVGAEAANVIAIAINVDDLLGTDAAAATRLQVRLWTDANLTTAANAAAFPLTDGGDGSIEATDMGIVAIIGLTGGSARLQLNCTDSLGGSGSTLYGTAEVLGSTPVFSAKARFVVTFDGV